MENGKFRNLNLRSPTSDVSPHAYDCADTRLWGVNSDMSESAYEYTADFLLKLGFMKEPVSYDKLFDRRFIDRIVKGTGAKVKAAARTHLRDDSDTTWHGSDNESVSITAACGDTKLFTLAGKLPIANLIRPYSLALFCCRSMPTVP